MGRADERITRIEWAVLPGTRPYSLGKNARLAEHGDVVPVPVCRITTSDGATGIGLSRLSEHRAYDALGLPIAAAFSDEHGTTEAWACLDYVLWDLAGKRRRAPVYEVANGGASPQRKQPQRVRCYDTSLYFDDLLRAEHEDDHGQAAAVVAEKAALSYERGHRAFKVKVGRGARWMEPGPGLERDIAVTGAVRDAIGPRSALLVDANNGYTLNMAVDFLDRTAGLHVEWIEEPFHEDAILLQALRQWLDQAGLQVLVADGESASADEGYALAAKGLVDVVQCDILSTTFSGWLRLGQSLDAIGVASAPHHFGAHLGNYVSGHLTRAVKGLRYIEWDETATPGIAVSGFELSEGYVQLSNRPGFGIDLDDAIFSRATRSTGFDLRITHGG